MAVQTICLGEYETEEQLREKIQQLGYEMARTGSAISLSIRKEQIENAGKSGPIRITMDPITIDLETVFNSLTPENKMILTKSLLSLMTDEELKSVIELLKFGQYCKIMLPCPKAPYHLVEKQCEYSVSLFFL